MPKSSELGDRETVDVWTNMSPSESGGEILSRERFSMVYDSTNDRTVVFGGWHWDPMKFLYDTWAYNFNTNTWVNRSPSYSGGMLSKRVDFDMAYDSINDCTVLYGGTDTDSGDDYNDTWIYNYGDNMWSKMSPGFVGGTLSGRIGHFMTYDSDAERVILYGGYNTSMDIVYNDTWTYSVSDNKWYNMSPSDSGGSRPKVGWSELVYDVANKLTVLFGGTTGFNINATWVYNFSSNTWLKRNPSYVGGTLTPRSMHGMAYDSNAEHVVMFGGKTSSVDLNDTWVYKTSIDTWYKIDFKQVGDNLYPREGSEIVYDSSSDKIVLFSGWANQAGGTTIKDTWAFTYNINLENNQAPNTPDQPSGPTYLNSDESGEFFTSATDPDADQVQYQFDWDANGDHEYSWTKFVQSGTEANLSHSWSTGGTYVVKARARDFYGNISGWSSGLTVVVNSAPNSPSDPDPTDGATDVDINADLSWDCSDPEGDSLTYDVYFEADDPTPDEMVSSQQSEKWYDPGTMDYDTDYYWQIVAWDKYDASTEGPIWSFTTGSDPNNPPNTPFNPSPEDGATDVDVEDDLSWECDDPDGDNVTYDVYLDTVDPPEEKVSDDQNETTFDPGTLLFETNYYWQVIAKDEHGASTPGIIWQFTTRDNNPPDVTTIDGPDKGSPETSYEYGFTAIDPDGDDIGEFIVKWGDSTGEEIITGPFASGEEALASHSWDEKGTYTIQAKAKDVYDAESNWSYFDIEIPRNRATFNSLFLWFFERFPMLERLLTLIIAG